MNHEQQQHAMTSASAIIQTTTNRDDDTTNRDASPLVTMRSGDAQSRWRNEGENKRSTRHATENEVHFRF